MPGRTGLAALVQIQPHPVLKKSNGVIQRPVPGEVGAQGVPDDAGQLVLRPVELSGVVDQLFVPFGVLLRQEDIEKVPQLKILATSPEAGIYALSTESGRQIFITGHSEYDADTLDQEYRRDKSQGKPIEIPKNYYPGDDDTRPPRVTWRSCANLLYSNWLNYFVYQTTPFDLSEIPGAQKNG